MSLGIACKSSQISEMESNTAIFRMFQGGEEGQAALRVRDVDACAPFHLCLLHGRSVRCFHEAASGILAILGKICTRLLAWSVRNDKPFMHMT